MIAVVTRSRGRIVIVVGVVVVVVVVVVVMVASWRFLQGDQERAAAPVPTPQRTPSMEASQATEDAVVAFAAEYLTTTPVPVPLASGRGNVENGAREKVPGTVDVLAVEANDTSTVLRWRLRTDESTRIWFPALARSGRNDTSGVVLTSRSTDQKLLPGTYVQLRELVCTCGRPPTLTGPEGVELSVVYGPLAEGATQVEVTVPGFAPVVAPVTRKGAELVP